MFIVFFNNNLCNLYPGNFIEDTIIKTDTFEPHLLRLFKSIIKEGDVCLDIGANIGFHSINISDLVGNNGKVFAFEPIDYLLKKLNTNIHLSGSRNISIIPNAVSSFDRKGHIFEIDESFSEQGSSSLFKNEFLSGIDKKEGVLKKKLCEVITLDKWILDNNIQKVDFIKMDIEGGEYNALLGMKQLISKFCPYIIIEYKNTRMKKLNITNLKMQTHFEQLYDCYEITKKDIYGSYSLEPFNFDRYIDADLLCIPRNY